MYLTAERKKEIFKTYGGSDKNTGSVEGQVALFTERIIHLSDLQKKDKKDMVTKRALVLLVGKRRKMLEYLKAKDIERYRALIKQLGLRK
ncbi:MAG: 30S ribosomal protein S15 [Bacteroidales bacterium]|jgi:small subunit ribosomal protein S15|nr:30S ribosomal protein S15 [Bacteroidales bacterium]